MNELRIGGPAIHTALPGLVGRAMYIDGDGLADIDDISYILYPRQLTATEEEDASLDHFSRVEVIVNDDERKYLRKNMRVGEVIYGGNDVDIKPASIGDLLQSTVQHVGKHGTSRTR